MSCPCGTGLEYSQCCEPYILGDRHAPTPEALMRSRYTAYVKGQAPYLRETLAPEERHDFRENEVREWSRSAEWLGLKVVKAEGDKVEFVAKYKAQGKVLEHHEMATFRRKGERWYFVDGDSRVQEEGQGRQHQEPLKPVVRAEPKVGRNDPCACGSGKKFKKCHGAA